MKAIQIIRYMPKKFYVTFFAWKQFRKEKIAVECDNMDDVRKVAYDCNSLDGTGNIRLRKCGKPKGRHILSVENYFHHSNWYN